MFRLFFIAIFFLTACSSEPPTPVSEPPAVHYIEQGRNLAKGLAACGFCHGSTSSTSALLSGGQKLYDLYGEVTAPNITPAGSGLKDWTTADIMSLFRTGERPDGRRISGELHSGFEWMSDADLLAIISYLKNIPAIENNVQRRSLSRFSRSTTGFFQSEKEVTGHVPEIEKIYLLEFGQYLTDHVARCASCHNTPSTLFSEEKYLAGGKMIRNSNGEKVAPNITQAEISGIGSWSEEEIHDFLLSGETPDGRSVDAQFCPVEYFAQALPEDLVALARYLKSAAPIE